MPQLRIALCQLNVTVGAIAANAEAILSRAAAAAVAGADLIVFPEMALTGYPVEDLALRRSFQQASREALDALPGRLAEVGAGDAVVVVGYLDAAADDVPRLG